MIDEHLDIVLVTFACTAAAQWAILRGRLPSVLDPLVYFLVTSAFSLTLGTFVIADASLVLRVYTYFACFYAGLLVVLGRRSFAPAPAAAWIDGRAEHFRAVLIGCVLIYVALNAILWYRSGLILFSDDPSLQKSEAYMGGLGFVRRFNWSVGAFLLVATVYWALWEIRPASVVALVVVAATAVVSGSKAALLPAVVAIGMYLARPFASRSGRDASPCLRPLVPFVALAAAVPVAAVLIVENGDLVGAFNAFVVRLFYFGDVLIYWGDDGLRQHFSSALPLDYIQNTFGSVLGALRLVDYGNPIGSQFVQYTLPPNVDVSEGIGPNLPFYVSGELFFGMWLAPLHAFAIGAVFGAARRAFLHYRGASLLRYSVLAFLVFMSLTLTADEGLAVGQLFDFALFFLPILALSSLLRKRTRLLEPAARTA